MRIGQNDPIGWRRGHRQRHGYRRRVGTRSERTMANSSQPEERGGDYSYDLVHEEVRGAQSKAGRTARPVPVTQTPEETNGDYSYDMAHDIPAQDG